MARIFCGQRSPNARFTPKSVCGKASGQDKARMAMYCAVRAPIPGIACSCVIVLTTSACGFSTNTPEATA